MTSPSNPLLPPDESSAKSQDEAAGAPPGERSRDSLVRRLRMEPPSLIDPPTPPSERASLMTRVPLPSDGSPPTLLSAADPASQPLDAGSPGAETEVGDFQQTAPPPATLQRTAPSVPAAWFRSADSGREHGGDQTGPDHPPEGEAITPALSWEGLIELEEDEEWDDALPLEPIPPSRIARWTPLILGFILVGAAALRFVGLNWDDGHHLHPDERFITMVAERIRIPDSLDLYVDTARSPMNPYNKDIGSYIYGTFPLFFVRGVAEATQSMATLLPLPTTGPIGDFTKGWRTAASYSEITLVGRALSGLADLLTIFFVFLIGRRLYGVGVGLLAAFFAGFSVLQIQAGHFFTAESPTTLFMVIAFYAAIRASETISLRVWALLGVAVGIAVASKITAAMLGVVVLTAAWVLWSRIRRGEDRRKQRFVLEDVATGLAVVGVTAFIAFRLAQPYAFAGPGLFNVLPNPKYLADVQTWQQFATGQADYPPSHQWAGATPYVWQLTNMTLWGLGPPLMIAAWLGFLLAAVRFIRDPERNYAHLFGLVWVGINFAYWGVQFAKPMRYLLPIYPQLAIFAALFLVWLWRWARSREILDGIRRNPPFDLRHVDLRLDPRRVVAGAITFAVVGWTVFYALAFASIYTRTTTRVEASEWIYANVPPRSAVAWEHWDDPLPLRLGGKEQTASYRGVELPMYGPDNLEKRGTMISKLDESDFIVLSSNRLYGSIPKLPQRYPMTTRYYQALFAGELGFERAAVFTSRPQLLGIELNDDNAEEIFTVYEHPRVDVFKKSASYSSGQVRAVLESVSLDRIVNVKPIQVGSTGLLLSPRDVAATHDGGTWSAIFDRASIANGRPLLVWYLVLQALALLALPLTWFVFRRLGDAGYAMAKTLAVLVIAFVPWLLASLHLLAYTRASILLAVAAMAVVSGLVVLRSATGFAEALRVRWRPIVATEAIFALGYLGFALIRAWNPDLWHSSYGGEKPMDFAYLNAIIKTSFFPPYDPWMAGGYINYYYFGQVVVASVTKLSGVVPWVAYNLAIPTIAALTMINVASVVYNILVSRPTAPTRRQLWAIAGGVVGALMAVVLGNLHGFVQIVDYLGKVATPTDTPIPVVAGLSGAVRGLLVVAMARGQGLPPPPLFAHFNFWDPTRVITTEPTNPITEFPYFTFLYGDLHAHMISMPFQLLVLALALNLLRQPSWLPDFHGLTRSGVARAGLQAAASPAACTLFLAGLTIAALRMINTWDYPTYLGLVIVAIFMSEALRKERVWTEVGIRTLVLGAAVAIVGQILIAPYLRHYELFYSGFERSAFHTTLPHYFIVLGAFLTILAIYLGFQLSAVRNRVASGALGALGSATSLPPASSVTAAGTMNVMSLLDRVAVAAAAFVAFVAILLLLAGMPVVGVAVVGIGALALITALRPMSPSMRFTFLLAATALALTAGVEVITLKGDIGRMNTVFKFYLQVWLLLSVTSAVMTTLLARRMWGSRWLQASPRRLAAVAVATLLALTLIYPLMGTPSKLQHRFVHLPLSLDGMEFMSVAKYIDKDNQDLALPDDYRAINWMLDTIPGTPTIVEGIAPLYHWRSRVSIWTGLPTVQGWDWHQKQQRGDFGYMVDERERDVQTIFNSTQTDAVVALLDKYGVEYIYVGGQERVFHAAAGIAKFEAMVGSSLTRVYQGGQVTIYQVER